MTYTYDAENFTSLSQTFDADNRLLTHNGESVTIDADGNLTVIAAGVSPLSYGYDIRNRLTSAGTLTYTYDAENRRVAQTDGANTTTYVINPNAALDQVLMKTVGGVTTFYVYGLGLLHEETNEVVRYYHFDRRGDTVALTDGSGNVTGSASYGVFGEMVSSLGTLATPFLFNGRWGVQTDSNGLYYHRARYYHPSLRRFLNQDVMLGSITNGASMNRFAYANGNPVTLIDPFGLMPQDASPTWPGLVLGTLGEMGGQLGQEALRNWDFVNRNVISPFNQGMENFADLLGEVTDIPVPGSGPGVRNVVLAALILTPMGEERMALGAAGGADDAARWVWSQNKGVPKSIRQMDARGWTPQQVTEAIKTGQKTAAENLVNPGNPAIRYIHPGTGQSVVQDTVTKEIIHFGGQGFKY